MTARCFLACLLCAQTFSARAAQPPGAPAASGYQQRQFEKIDAQVGKIRAHSAAGAQMYFLGVAGFAMQRVFAEEIAFASRRVAEAYGSVDRSLWLINDRRDIDTYPRASGPALLHALKQLGRVMDQDDMLFLALSSHGSGRSGLVISDSGLPDDWISPANLAGMLKESGIRWRIVVVSACYSGNFIEPLADNHSIVITASSSGRNSFGCSDDRDLTYFGEAFYRDALPRTTSLRSAFELARLGIRQRETEKFIRPSQPQAYFGPVLEGKLSELQSSKREPAPDR